MFNPVISTHTNPAPSGSFLSGKRSSSRGGVRSDNDPASIHALQCAVDAAQALYDDTRAHKHLIRLQDAKHALIAAEVAG